MEDELYFVHSYYSNSERNQEFRNDKFYVPNRDRIVLIKDNINDLYDVDIADVSAYEQDYRCSEGEFVYYRGGQITSAEDNITALMYRELSRVLTNNISYLNYENIGKDTEQGEKEVKSFHVNVGHGNCSIIVFGNCDKWEMWMVDCSVFDYTEKKNYQKNLEKCLQYIMKKYEIYKISKLLITHHHYDHINGIEYLIKNKWIDNATEVWLNLKYPWSQPSYLRILSLLNSTGVKFIDPIVGNSTKNIKILYPEVSFNRTLLAPNNHINNASVLYQIMFGNMSMLFTGDIETEGWDRVMCQPYLNETEYFCIAHHGSINGLLRNNCRYNQRISSVSECASGSKKQILMGRDKAYSGIFNETVLRSFSDIVRTDSVATCIELDWNRGTIMNM